MGLMSVWTPVTNLSAVVSQMLVAEQHTLTQRQTAFANSMRARSDRGQGWIPQGMGRPEATHHPVLQPVS